MVENLLKFKSGGETVLQEYQETESLTDATRRRMINILVAHMIDTHGYLIYTGAGHIIRISSKSRFISLIPFKK